MKINLNSGGVPKAEPTQPAARTDATAAATDGTSFQATSALTNKLKDLPAVRSEKVEKAKTLVSDSKYPPNDVLDRIAILLAARVKQSS